MKNLFVSFFLSIVSFVSFSQKIIIHVFEKQELYSSTRTTIDSVILNPDTGITDIERIRFNGNNITNLDATALTLVSTGIGYVRFMDTNALLIPAGTDAERSASSEVGDTRWNTNNPADNYMECFDGTTWIISTGPGGSISTVENSDLANAYILILG